jgi:hypothetical protein
MVATLLSSQEWAPVRTDLALLQWRMAATALPASKRSIKADSMTPAFLDQRLL